MTDQELREYVVNRYRELEKGRDPYLNQWQKISQYIRPANGKFLTPKDRNEAKDKWNNIIDNTPMTASNVLAAGLMTGLTDPSSQWFFLTTGNPSLDESVECRRWLSDVSQILYMAFARTNTYQALHHGWMEAGLFGIMAIVIEADEETGFHCVPLTAGEYCVDCNSRGQPDTLYRKFAMSVRQLVEEFGEDAVPTTVLERYKSQKYDDRYNIIHAIEPRAERNAGSKDAKHMPFRSIYVMEEGADQKHFILRESGYRSFPAVVGRWGAVMSEPYSSESPGMLSLGDAMQLQYQQKQKGNAIDYMIKPPIGIQAETKNNEIDTDPGGITFINSASVNRKTIESMWDVNIQLAPLTNDIEDIRSRIRSAFNVDMFLMLNNQSALSSMTATAVAELHEEKLLMLGPVLSRFNNEVLKPLIDRTFDILDDAGMIPPAPKELQGSELNIEYTSVLSRSQKEMQSRVDQQMIAEAMQIAQADPSYMDNFDLDKYAQVIADKRGISPEIIRSTDEVQALRQQRQQAQAQAAQAQQMAQGADVMAKLGKIPNDGSTMASQALDGMQEMMAAGGPAPEGM